MTFAQEIEISSHELSSRKISKTHQPFLIAEIGLNHNKSVELAKDIISAAKESGADAVKFQSYTTEKFIHSDAPRVQEMYEIFKKYELSLEEHEILKSFAEKEQLFFFSTPLTLDWVDHLEELDVFAYKIASGDLNNYLLMKKIIDKKRPVIMSTGAAYFSDIQASVNFFQKYEFSPLVILHCISLYPTPFEKANIYRMLKIEEEFGTLCGFSDHTLDDTAAGYASLLGACVIEKHFTIDKNMPGPDHHLSMTPREFSEVRKQIDIAFEMRQNSQKDSWKEEMSGDYFGKRSLYEVEGEKIPMRPRQAGLPKDSDGIV